jgi:pimeloyl-ACP methyl ester carboxylesterase
MAFSTARQAWCASALAFVGAAGCGLNTAVLQTGGNGRQGVLLNYSCGAEPDDPIDPRKPTVVFTHGWNPLPEKIRTTFGPASAAALRQRCGDRFNLLSWDWNGVRIATPLRNEPYRVGCAQGRRMAAALRERGVAPGRTHIVAHSLGSVVAAEATRILAEEQGPVRQLTLLDPPTVLHDEIFGELAPQRHALEVENYWSPGASGFGAEVDCPGVANYCVRGGTPWRGAVDLSLSNHVHVMRWYYDTIRCPRLRGGFQRSAVLRAPGGLEFEPPRPLVASAGATRAR